MSSDGLQSTTNPEAANYDEYNFDDSKMTVEDNGKMKALYFSFFLFLISFHISLYIWLFLGYVSISVQINLVALFFIELRNFCGV